MSDPPAASPPDDTLSIQYWSSRWQANKLGFHIQRVNPILLHFLPQLTGQSLTTCPLQDPVQLAHNSQLTWFVPLCGKSVDIPYLLSQGFRVFAVEAVKLAIEQLEEEHRLGLRWDESKNLFTGADGRLQIYVGDFFQCPVEEYAPFHFVWDRASFIALDYGDRAAYSKVMQRALAKQGKPFKYLMESVLYDVSQFGGLPRNTTDADLETYFGKWASVRVIKKEVPGKDNIFAGIPGEVYVRTVLITPSPEGKEGGDH